MREKLQAVEIGTLEQAVDAIQVENEADPTEALQTLQQASKKVSSSELIKVNVSLNQLPPSKGSPEYLRFKGDLLNRFAELASTTTDIEVFGQATVAIQIIVADKVSIKNLDM